MLISKKDKKILRNLANRVLEIACSDTQMIRKKLWTDLNSLQMGKPLVLAYSFPWSEINSPELAIETQSMRELESYLKRIIYKWKHFAGDMVIDKYYSAPIFIKDTGIGFSNIRGEGNGITLCDNIHTIDNESPQTVKAFVNEIKSESDIDRLKQPIVSIDTKRTDNNFNIIKDTIGDILSINKVGVLNYRFGPSDELVRIWGIQKFMIDLVDNPNLIHKAMTRITDLCHSRLDQYENLGLLVSNNNVAGSMTGGMGENFTNELSSDYPQKASPVNLWGSSSAQIMDCVSPQMHMEFALKYELSWLSRFGLTCYGCCERLDNKVENLKKIHNLRKVSVTSWNNLDVIMEFLSGRYVCSYHPNPSILASSNIDLENAKNELFNVVKLARKYGCQLEIVMKTMITIGKNPDNLVKWLNTAMNIAENY